MLQILLGVLNGVVHLQVAENLSCHSLSGKIVWIGGRKRRELRSAFLQSSRLQQSDHQLRSHIFQIAVFQTQRSLADFISRFIKSARAQVNQDAEQQRIGRCRSGRRVLLDVCEGRFDVSRQLMDHRPAEQKTQCSRSFIELSIDHSYRPFEVLLDHEGLRQHGGRQVNVGAIFGGKANHMTCSTEIASSDRSLLRQ